MTNEEYDTRASSLDLTDAAFEELAARAVACIVNFRATRRDIEATLEIIRETARAL